MWNTHTKRLHAYTQWQIRIQILALKACGVTVDRCEWECGCQCPSSERKRGVRLYRQRFNRTPAVVTGGLRIAAPLQRAVTLDRKGLYGHRYHRWAPFSPIQLRTPRLHTHLCIGNRLRGTYRKEKKSKYWSEDQETFNLKNDLRHPQFVLLCFISMQLFQAHGLIYLCFNAPSPFLQKPLSFFSQTRSHTRFLCTDTQFYIHNWAGRIRTSPFLLAAGNIHCLLNRHRLSCCSEPQAWWVILLPNFQARVALNE